MIKNIFKKDIFILLIFLALAFVTYSMSLKGSFLQMDDIAGVVDNEYVRDFNKVIESGSIKNLVNHYLIKTFGENPLPFHAVSIGIHFLNSVFVFLLVKLLFDRKTALIATLIFIVHPANSEAVSWISGSIYLYQALFWLISIYFYAVFRKKGKILALVPSYLSVIVYAFTIRSAWVVVLPLTITVLDIFILSKKYTWKSALALIPYYLSFAYYLVFNYAKAMDFRTSDLEYYYVGTTAQGRLISILRVIYNSLGLYVVPFKLNILFGSFNRTPLNILVLVVSALFLAYVLYFFFRKNKTNFALLLCIYISIIPLFSPISIGLGYAERYFYFGTVFFVILAASLILELNKKVSKKSVGVMLLALIVPLFMFRTVIRTLDWRSDRALWTAAQAASPNSYEVYNELGNVYYRENDLRAALANYEKALEIRPQYPEVMHNVGLVYIKAGQFVNAKLFLVKSLQLNPNVYESYYRLGQIAVVEGNLQQARIYYGECLRINPDFVPAQQELAKIQ